MEDVMEAMDDGLLTLFWGSEVSPGQPIPFVPPPQEASLRLTQATLSVQADAGAKAALKVAVNGGPALQVCLLREGQQENAHLDLLFDHYAEFSVEGNCAITIIGYLCPSSKGEGDDDEQPTLEELMAMKNMHMLPGMEEDEEDDDDDDEFDEDSEFNEDEDDDEDESDEEDADAAEVWGFGNRQKADHTIIEELEDEKPETKQEPAAMQAPAAAPKRPAAEDKQKGMQQKVSKKRAAEAAAAAAAASEQEKALKKAKGADGVAVEVQANGAAKINAEATTQKQSKKQKEQQRQRRKEQQLEVAEQQKQQAEPTKTNQKPKIRKFDNGFAIETIATAGSEGKLAKAGSKVAVRYTGRLASTNKVFDATKGKPFTFRLGIGEVVKGFDRGVEGMRVGDKRVITIPPQMGYGAEGVRGTIPPNATLKFEIELVDVKN